MLKITLNDANWVERQPDPPDDQCAHGDVDVTIDDKSLFKPDGVVGRGKNLSASAAGLFLLRTIFDDHGAGHRVSADMPLIPCCGHAPRGGGIGDGYPVYIMGCPNGADLSVRHDGDEIVLGEPGPPTRISRAAWRTAVLDFVRDVEAFYAASSPKLVPEDEFDAKGWAAFWAEWSDLKRRAELEGT